MASPGENHQSLPLAPETGEGRQTGDREYSDHERRPQHGIRGHGAAPIVKGFAAVDSGEPKQARFGQGVVDEQEDHRREQEFL